MSSSLPINPVKRRRLYEEIVEQLMDLIISGKVPAGTQLPSERELVDQFAVGRSAVRVGITQFPAGFGVQDGSDLKPDLVDACENIRMGTALFGKVYRIVTKWYGNAVEEAFDDAVIAWQTGYFEGTAVFRAEDPGEVELATPSASAPGTTSGEAGSTANRSGERDEQSDPNKAGIRVDLSGIGTVPP